LKYDGFVQMENGVGMVRSLLDDWRKARRTALAGGLPRPVSVVLACATLIGPTFEQIAVEMCAVPNLRARVATVQNDFFGPVVTVSGLLTGRDILAATADARAGELLFVPRVALDGEGEALLDGMTLAEFEAQTPATVVVAGSIPEVVAAIKARAGQPAPAPATTPAEPALAGATG
jgi:NifB/MoaA-like Fe-S oxidoreductase